MRLFFIAISLLSLAFLLATPWIELELSSQFYNPQTGRFSHHPYFAFFYEYGQQPALAVSCLAALVYLLSFCFPLFRPLRSPAAVLVLTLALGAGVLVNGLLKTLWGRPRPKQIEAFGGEAKYLPFYRPDFSQGSSYKSFPSGHAAMGFYFSTFSLIGYWLKRRLLLLAGLLSALFFSLSLSLARIAQGAHFLSDILASALIMWITGYFCCRFLLK